MAQQKIPDVNNFISAAISRTIRRRFPWLYDRAHNASRRARCETCSVDLRFYRPVAMHENSARFAPTFATRKHSINRRTDALFVIFQTRLRPVVGAHRPFMNITDGVWHFELSRTLLCYDNNMLAGHRT